MRYIQLFYYGLLLNIICQPISFADIEADSIFKGSWHGIEVIGTDNKTASVARRLIPIKKGDPFSYDKEKFNQWCKDANVKLGKELQCSFTGFVGGQFYYNIEFISSDLKKRKFREIPQKQILERIPDSLNALHNKWESLFSKFVNEGNVPKQFFKDGFLQTDEETSQNIAKKLSQTVPKFNTILLDTIKYSPDPDERMIAATLLSWAKNNNNIKIILNENLLNDPDPGVRNELSRTLSYVLNNVKDEEILQSALVVFCDQLNLPSHSDRTKALASMQTIFQQQSKLKSLVSKECRNRLVYLSEMSILPNVGGVAKEILKPM